MDPDELERAVQQLRADLEEERRKQARLVADFTQLSAKLRSPGTKFLVDLEYRLVYENTALVIPLNYTGAVPIETLPGKLHALYLLSAYAVSDTTAVVVTDGPLLPVTTPLADGVSIAIERQLATSPARILVGLRVANTRAANAVTVAVRVWRRLGMGS